MDHKGTVVLETERLILRRFVPEDAETMYRNWASDPEVTRFLTWPTHSDVEITKKVLSEWIPLYERKDYYHWTITLREDISEPIGTIHGQMDNNIDSVMVGYCLSQSKWHKGIMSEALSEVMRFFFEDVGVNRVCSYHDPRNPHSGMVMTHCGMKFDGTLRSSDRNNMGICDASWYSMLRSEYKARTK